ncbi:MAG: flagellar export chaperone FliS [Epsilonproteobacteria bacterium]|nr:flagellar export chaperone FliS [Campylobacterota bacterium]
MRSNLAYSEYTQNNVSIESKEKLVEMLYEGILRFNYQAKKAINSKDYEKKSYWINRSVDIFVELINSLNYDGGDTAHYLNGLYQHQIKLLTTANMQNDVESLDTVNKVVKGLLEAWREINAK